MHLAYLFFGESCVAFHLRDVLLSSSHPVVQGTVSLHSVVFFCLDNLGEDFQVVVVALIGDLQSSDFRITLGRIGDLLVDKAREVTCLDADTVEVFVEESNSSLGIVGNLVIGFV